MTEMPPYHCFHVASHALLSSGYVDRVISVRERRTPSLHGLIFRALSSSHVAVCEVFAEPTGPMITIVGLLLEYSR